MNLPYVLRFLSELVEFIKSDWFDPRKSFLTLPAFWFPTIIIIFIAAIIFGKIINDHNLQFDMAADVDEWVKLFQVPIGVMALLIPVLGLLNANHKSEQTKATMELSKTQNNFVNYYKHLEEFYKYVEKINPEKDSHGKIIIDIDARKLHGFLFPGAHDGIYGISNDVVERFENSFNNFIQAVKDFCAMAEYENPHGKLFNALKCRDDLQEIFNGLIDGVRPNYAEDFECNRILKVPDYRENLWIPKSLRIFFTEISRIYKQIYIVMAFDTKYDPNNQQKNKILGLCDKFLSMKFELDLITNDWDEGDYAVSNDDLRKIKEILSAFFEEAHVR